MPETPPSDNTTHDTDTTSATHVHSLPHGDNPASTLDSTNVAEGDWVHVHGAWMRVRRVNRKSVSVPDPLHPAPVRGVHEPLWALPWHALTGHRTTEQMPAGFVEVYETPGTNRAVLRSDGEQGIGTPVFDELNAALGDLSRAATTGPTTTDIDEVAAWVDQWYGDDPPTSWPGIDPDTPEGAAIMRLFRRVKEVQQADGTWPGGDTVEQLLDWFHAVGIDPALHPLDADCALRLAARRQASHPPTVVHYTARISTQHVAPEPVISDALQALVTGLGPGTTADLTDADGTPITRFGHSTDS